MDVRLSQSLLPLQQSFKNLQSKIKNRLTLTTELTFFLQPDFDRVLMKVINTGKHQTTSPHETENP